MAENSELVCVRTCQGWDVAQIYKSKLEAAGIPVLLKYEAVALVYGLTVDGLGRVRIMVPESCAAEAEELLEDRETPIPSAEEGELSPSSGEDEPLRDECADQD